MRKQLIVAFVALLLGATACGDDTDNADTEPTTSTATVRRSLTDEGRLISKRPPD